MSHLTYILDLAPLYYYLFWSIAYFLCSWHSNNQEDVAASVKKFFPFKDRQELVSKNWLKGGFR